MERVNQELEQYLHLFVNNVILLLPTLSNPILGWKAHPPPPPEIVDREEHYIVEWRLDSWVMRGCL